MNPVKYSYYCLNFIDDSNLQVIIFSGGTGIAPRDNTYDVVNSWLDKPIPGFGEIFRYLSYQEIGSRAIAGVKNKKLIFSWPSSSNAVR